MRSTSEQMLWVRELIKHHKAREKLKWQSSKDCRHQCIVFRCKCQQWFIFTVLTCDILDLRSPLLSRLSSCNLCGRKKDSPLYRCAYRGIRTLMIHTNSQRPGKQVCVQSRDRSARTRPTRLLASFWQPPERHLPSSLPVRARALYHGAVSPATCPYLWFAWYMSVTFTHVTDLSLSPVFKVRHRGIPFPSPNTLTAGFGSQVWSPDVLIMHVMFFCRGLQEGSSVYTPGG